MTSDHSKEAPAATSDRLERYPPRGSCEPNNAAQKRPLKGNDAGTPGSASASGQVTASGTVEIVRAPSVRGACYRCGEVGHTRASCPRNPPAPSSACFRCQQPGHKASACPHRGMSDERATASARQAAAEAKSQSAPTSTPSVIDQLNALYQVHHDYFGSYHSTAEATASDLEPFRFGP